MANVLLLVPPNRPVRGALCEAMRLACDEGGRLLIVAALDSEAIDRASATITDMGFMGEKVGDGVRETLMRDYRQRADQDVAELTALARDGGTDAEGLIEEGDPAEICRRLVSARDIDIVVAVAERRSWLARLLSRSAARVPALAGCEVRVAEEDER